MPEPRWALMCRVGHKREVEFDEFEESSIDIQRAEGWELLAYDSDIPYKKRRFPDPAQSNPNRNGDPGGD
jgi:hypothetical protein